VKTTSTRTTQNLVSFWQTTFGFDWIK